MATIAGPWAGGFMGTAVAGDFDYDQDGVSDFAAGAPFANNSSGHMQVWSGVNGAQLSNWSGSELLLGSTMTGGIDLDGNGSNDLVFADTNGVYAAPTALAVLIPGALGSSLGRAGDVNGDGRRTCWLAIGTTTVCSPTPESSTPSLPTFLADRSPR